MAHIAAHSTGHSECIVTGDEKAAHAFQRQVDSAAVYWNASTRFTDGGEFGLGCEMGISTQKLHAGARWAWRSCAPSSLSFGERSDPVKFLPLPRLCLCAVRIIIETEPDRPMFFGCRLPAAVPRSCVSYSNYCRLTERTDSIEPLS